MTLTGSALAVLRALVERGPSTRPQLGQDLGLSRPTMSAAIAELIQAGLVEPIGAVQGGMGRRAVEYRVATHAGHVIAVDAGSTHIRLRLSTLDRRLLHSSLHPLPQSQYALTPQISAVVAAAVAEALARTEADWGPLQAMVIAVPTRVVGPEGDTAATDQEVIYSNFTPPPQVECTLVNNVNCAAVAEYHYGAAQGRQTFAFLQVGVKIGLGLMLNGQILRGVNGAAGEIGHISFPFAPGLIPLRGEAERYLGTEAFMARVRAGWPADAGPPPRDTYELLARAGTGDATALAHVEEHAAQIGAVIAICVSVIDPGLVVLGGGYGASPLLRPKVEEVVRRLAFPAEITTSTLAAEATVLGAERLAVERAVSALLGLPC
ncbi:ROK family transcriptional regulator (plasmid) [Rhodobacter capsulatus]